MILPDGSARVTLGTQAVAPNPGTQPRISGIEGASTVFPNGWDPTKFDLSKMSDAGKTVIDVNNLSKLIYGLNSNEINGPTGLVQSILKAGYNIKFIGVSLEGKFGESQTYEPRIGKIQWLVRIDTAKMAGSLNALAIIVAHELQHGLTEIAAKQSGQYTQYIKDAKRAEILRSFIKARAMSGHVDRYYQLMYEYYMINPVEAPSYRREAAVWSEILQ